MPRGGPGRKGPRISCCLLWRLLFTEDHGTESTDQETPGQSLVSEPLSPHLANGENAAGKVKRDKAPNTAPGA